AGANPILISVIGSIAILFFAIYLTQGFGRKSHLANLALIISLVFTAVMSFVFTNLAQLSGYLGEETIFLLESSQGNINLQGLLLAGIMLGTLGVLDDVIISQISTVEQIKLANPNLSKKQVYKMSLKVGVDHITSMINTLFFAYAGVALPMLILFSQSDVLGLNLTQVINNEMIATEIIRTLLGSIGLVFSIPIANFLASYFLTLDTKK
nr:YibE/F family protein [Patescibacteria group bacterium]